MPEPPIPTNEELEDLKRMLSKSEDEKKSLQEKLGIILQENQSLKEENALRERTIENSNKKLKTEEASRKEVQRYLKGANDEVKRCNLKLTQAMDDAHNWKALWEESKIAERTAYSFLKRSKQESRMMMAGLKDQMRSIREDKEKIEEILGEYQEALRSEQERSDRLRDHIEYQEAVYRQLEIESDDWKARFAELVHRLESHQVFIELKNESLYWKDRFSKLAWLANQAVVGLPKRLKKVDASMHPLNTPTEVFEFVEFCKILIIELKREAGSSSKEKREKREKSGKMKAICS